MGTVRASIESVFKVDVSVEAGLCSPSRWRFVQESYLVHRPSLLGSGGLLDLLVTSSPLGCLSSDMSGSSSDMCRLSSDTSRPYFMDFGTLLGFISRNLCSARFLIVIMKAVASGCR